MQQDAILEAARLLVQARRDGRPLPALPTTTQPADFAEAWAIQEAMLALLGEKAVAYKVANITPESAMWGAVLQSRVRQAPATFAAAQVPMLGVEPEIAFRLEEEVGPAHRSLTLEAFDRMTSVLTTIEIVDTRFTSYEGTPLLHRAADFMSNGGLVLGEVWTGVRRDELAALEVTVEIGGTVAARVKGGHANGDPRLPALGFLQAPGRPAVIPRGTVITTGSYAGLLRARPGDTVTARFTGHTPISLRFVTETDS
ncbi:MAG TPA: hypothetical protein VGN83_25545 [Falsiroseomonas sp.]|jgi:2-keto-4-pentenoate hydratase|nr:hypothetical protein [Falsiroseomonas sp.]